MLVVIKEIIAALAPIPVIYAAVFTWSRRLRLAERAGERFGGEVFIGLWFGLGGGFRRLG